MDTPVYKFFKKITHKAFFVVYQRHIRNVQIERAQKILDNYKVEDVKKGPHDVTRFIKSYTIQELSGH